MKYYCSLFVLMCLRPKFIACLLMCVYRWHDATWLSAWWYAPSTSNGSSPSRNVPTTHATPCSWRYVLVVYTKIY